jgi:hypothetical protein
MGAEGGIRVVRGVAFRSFLAQKIFSEIVHAFAGKHTERCALVGVKILEVRRSAGR